MHPFKQFAMESDHINAVAHKMLPIIVNFQVHCTINTSCLSVTSTIETVQHSSSGCVGLTALTACTSQVMARCNVLSRSLWNALYVSMLE